MLLSLISTFALVTYAKGLVRVPSNNADCVACIQLVPECEPGCENCRVIPQTCRKCSRAICRDGPERPTTPPTTKPYNCFTRERWTQDKIDWCCENEQLGCPPSCEDKDEYAEQLFNFDFSGVDDCLSAVKFLELQALGTDSEGCDIPLANYEAFGLLNMAPMYPTLREMCCESCALPSVCTLDADTYRPSDGVCASSEESFILGCDETNCISNPECTFEDFGLDMDDFKCEDACEDKDEYAGQLFNFDFSGVDDCLSAVKFLELQALGSESEGCDIPLADYEAFGILNMAPMYPTLREMCCESCSLPSVCTLDADTYRPADGVCASGEESFTLYCDETNCISNPECTFEDFGLDMDNFKCEDDCVMCTQAIPQCEPGCQDCVVTPQTCKSCSMAICNDRGGPGPFPPHGECIMCPQFVPTCEPGCSNCEVTQQTCRECSRAVCMDGPEHETDALCRKIVEQEACDESCDYAFNDPELARLLPSWLTMDICQGTAGSYRMICAVECVMADLGLGDGMGSGDFDPRKCNEQIFINSCVTTFMDAGGCEVERAMVANDSPDAFRDFQGVLSAIDPKCLMCDNIGDVVSEKCADSDSGGSDSGDSDSGDSDSGGSEPETPLELLKHMIEEAEDLDEFNFSTYNEKQLKKIKKNMTKLSKLLNGSKKRVQNAIKAAKQQ